MKKGGCFVFLFVLAFLFSFILVNAQAENATTEQQKINAAYSCLKEKIEDTSCASLSTEEKIFSVLAVNSCRSELISSSVNSGECWSSTGTGACRIKTTSQAILALDKSGSNIAKAESWLISQNATPTNLQWFLEIEADTEGTSSCQISYSGFSSSLTIGEDKRLSSNAGPCLILAQNNHWLRVSPSCYDEKFSVSCDQDFLTTLLFRESGSSTVHVSPESNSAAQGGTTSEKVESSCLAESGACSYEGTLWGALALDSLGEDVSPYMPYLITSGENNRRFLPDAFLYFITSNSEHRTSLLSKQKSNKFWLESGNEFYDTAVALFPFQQETFLEKTNSKNWLLNDAQDANGCWENNIRDTAFVLASIWPGQSGSGSGGEGLPSCEASGFSCVSSGSCSSAGGEILSEYSCSSLSKCCSVQPAQVTCAESGGSICSSNQICRGGNSVGTGDLGLGQTCCVDGTCEARDVQQVSECENSGGVCRAFGCNENEEASSLSCSITGDSCCTTNSQGSQGSLWWVWVLLILIVLVVAGIIFREKLRMLWFRLKSKFRKGGSSSVGHRPGHPPHPPYHPSRRVPPGMQRRILLPPTIQPGPQHPRPHHSMQRPKSRAQKELDDVLKKLKDMSK